MDDDVWFGRYLQRLDGTWCLVGDDGWPVSVEDLCEFRGGAAAVAAAPSPVVDVEPVSVTDTEES